MYAGRNIQIHTPDGLRADPKWAFWSQLEEDGMQTNSQSVVQALFNQVQNYDDWGQFSDAILSAYNVFADSTAS